MRPLLSCLAAIAIATPALAQAPVTLLSYAGIFRDNYTEVVAAPFGPVQYVDVGTSAQMLGTLRAQRADPQVDVIIMDVTNTTLACAEGMVEPLTAAASPVFAELDPMARSAGGNCGPAVMYDHLVMIYDTRAISPAPRSLAAMWDPAQRGKVALSAPPNIQGLALTAILAHSMSGDWRNVTLAIPRLRELAPSVQTFNPNPDGYTLILNDQVRFATGWNARAQLYADQSQGRIGVVLPTEGTVFRISLNRTDDMGAMREAMTLDTYGKLLSDDMTLSLALDTLQLTAGCAAMAAALALPVTLAIRAAPPAWRGPLALAAVAPLLVSGTARIIG